MTHKALSWKPVRWRWRYCSTACGLGCTWAEYQQALRLGEALVAKLGKDWTAKIHENLGWHYHAVSPCERIRVWKSGKRTFIADLHVSTQFRGIATTPRIAVEHAVAAGNRMLHKFKTEMAGLEGGYYNPGERK